MCNVVGPELAREVTHRVSDFPPDRRPPPQPFFRPPTAAAAIGTEPERRNKMKRFLFLHASCRGRCGRLQGPLATGVGVALCARPLPFSTAAPSLLSPGRASLTLDFRRPSGPSRRLLRLPPRGLAALSETGTPGHVLRDFAGRVQRTPSLTFALRGFGTFAAAAATVPSQGTSRGHPRSPSPLRGLTGTSRGHLPVAIFLRPARARL